MNAFFTPDRVKGILEAKNYEAFDMVLPFIAALVDIGTGYIENALLTTAHIAYSAPFNEKLFDNSKMMLIYKHVSEIEWP